jgi:ABC-type polysaccharide/polyol phosphate export permease
VTTAAHDTSQASLPQINRPVKRRLRLSEIWSTYDIAKMLALRDIKAKYKQAALGPLWLLIAPLGMLIALTIAFSGVTDVDTGGVPYLLFALVGLTVWSFIQLSASMGAMAIIGNAGLVRRSPIPRVAFVSGSMLGNLPPILMMFFFAFVGTLVTQGLAWQILLMPLLVAWLLVFTMSLALLLSALAARFRDTTSALPLIIQAGIFISPVGYSMDGAPKNIHTLLSINPVSGLIEAWRWAILDMPHPQWDVMAVAGGWTVVIAALGWWIFGRMEVGFADYV